MNKLRKYLNLILFLFLIIIVPMNVNAETKINKTKATLYAGQTTTLKIDDVKDVEWSSSNNKVATVSSKGKVTAKKKGNTIITAKVGELSFTCKITVKNPYLNKTKVNLKKGKTLTLKLTGAKIKSCSSSNKNVVTVTKKGKIKAINKGVATIKVKASNNKTYKCIVAVLVSNSKYTPKEAITIYRNYLETHGMIWDPSIKEFASWGTGWIDLQNPERDAKMSLQGYQYGNGDGKPNTHHYLEVTGYDDDYVYVTAWSCD